MLASCWLLLPLYKDGKAWICIFILPHTKHLARARQAEGPIPDPVSCPFRDLSPCSWKARLEWFSSSCRRQDPSHICRTGNRIHHLGYGSFWLLSSSVYKVGWVFSAAAGDENPAQSTSKPVSFWLSKIVDFDSQIDEPIRATFLTAKPGGTRVSLRSIGTFRSKEFNLHRFRCGLPP